MRVVKADEGIIKELENNGISEEMIYFFIFQLQNFVQG